MKIEYTLVVMVCATNWLSITPRRGTDRRDVILRFGKRVGLLVRILLILLWLSLFFLMITVYQKN